MKAHMKTNILILTLLTTVAAMGQEIHHAPTAAQCKADVAVWKAESKADIIALDVKTLLLRSSYLYECSDVLSDTHDEVAVAWSNAVRNSYNQHALNRAMKFLDRTGLDSKFYEEDAKGAR